MSIADATPLWPSEVTAYGTLGIAAVAVLVALLSEWLINKRLAEERIRHAEETAEERKLADDRLAAQQLHSDAQLRAEREAADARIQEERTRAQEREQYDEAALIQVTEARMTPEAWGSQITSTPDVPIQCPAAIVVNRGRYTITRLQAQLCLSSSGNYSLQSYGKRELFSSLAVLPDTLTTGLAGEGRDVWGDTLRPADIGMRFSSDAIAERHLFGSYPIVRWRDRWGTWWEHRRGEVRQIDESEDWKP